MTATRRQKKIASIQDKSWIEIARTKEQSREVHLPSSVRRKRNTEINETTIQRELITKPIVFKKKKKKKNYNINLKKHTYR